MAERPAVVFCVKCAADVSALPPVAKFCTRCGCPLPPAFQQAVVEHDLLPFPEPFTPTQILLAYAQALINLGWRYETGVGWRKNLREATRCYHKASRLSHA